MNAYFQRGLKSAIPKTEWGSAISARGGQVLRAHFYLKTPAAPITIITISTKLLHSNLVSIVIQAPKTKNPKA